MTNLPTQHYMLMFWVLFFWEVYYESQINIKYDSSERSIEISKW
jgi:hypothetical protein